MSNRYIDSTPEMSAPVVSQRPIGSNSPSAADMDATHPQKQYDLPAMENNSATYALASAIRESTGSIIKAMGAPRTTIGVASALGLFCFSVPNFVNSMWQLQLSSAGQNMANIGAIGPVVFVAFIGQFLAGLWNLTKGDTFGAVAMGAYGLFWAMYGYLIIPAGANWTGTSTAQAEFLTSAASGASTATLTGLAQLMPFQESYLPFGALAMIRYGYTPVALGGAGMAVIDAVNTTNAFIGYCATPWLILTFIFCCCALRMALLELWIFIVVECVFICVLGNQFSSWVLDSTGNPVPSSTAVAWTKALGAWSLILAITAWYFIMVILVNQTYNAGILPMGHSSPVIEAWPHDFGSVKHQETHRNLNLYIPEKKMHRLRSDETPYNAEDMYHRSHNAGMGPAPTNDLEKRV